MIKKKEERDRKKAESRSLTNKEAREMVKKIGGFEEKSNPPFPTHGKAAFYNPKTGTWISADQDVHNGGRLESV